MNPNIKWNTTKKEDALIEEIVARATGELEIDDRVSLTMDLTACHCNGTPLDLPKLLAFDKFNFAHDIYGIMSHLSRKDGEIKHGFLPRCFKHEDNQSKQ
jgi:hypothetical protein